VANAAAGPVSPRGRRWRRCLVVLALIAAAAYAALWIVRWTREFVPVAPCRFLAGGPLVIAHRGASESETENSIAAYRRALADGADVLELDARLSRDGAIVVSHDPTLTRALGVPVSIADSDLADLRARLVEHRLGTDPADLLPTLDEVMVKFPHVRLNIELKTDSAALADAVAAAIERHARADDVLVASFHGEALRRLRAATRGRVATSASTGEAVRFVICYLLTVPCRPHYQALQIPPQLRKSAPRFQTDSAEFIAFAHRHGLAVHYWTIDDETTMARLLAAGADGIMTDAPARAVAARGANHVPPR
jgi:glycerophosphoryl diester phosphodiesterase